jgi:hypothetical protein
MNLKPYELRQLTFAQRIFDRREGLRQRPYMKKIRSPRDRGSDYFMQRPLRGVFMVGEPPRSVALHWLKRNAKKLSYVTYPF